MESNFFTAQMIITEHCITIPYIIQTTRNMFIAETKTPMPPKSGDTHGLRG